MSTLAGHLLEKQYCPRHEAYGQERKPAASTVREAWIGRLTAPSGDQARHARRIGHGYQRHRHNRAGPIGVEPGRPKVNDAVTHRQAEEHKQADPRRIYSLYDARPKKCPRGQAHEEQGNDEGGPTESFGSCGMGRTEVERVAHCEKSRCAADTDRQGRRGCEARNPPSPEAHFPREPSRRL
jgi:hypothetical protein